MKARRNRKWNTMTGMRPRRIGRGVSLIEMLVAVMLVTIAALGAMSSWAFAVRATANKRVTEIGAYIGIQQIERLKAERYAALAYTPQNAPLVDWYDKNGTWLGSAPGVRNGAYQAKTWIRARVDRDHVSNAEDLKEIEVQVLNSSGASQYEDVRTLLSSGGI